MQKSCVQTWFLSDTQHHQLRVLLDLPDYKHLRLQSPSSNAGWFEVLVAPNLLVFNGDMGSFTWRRSGVPFDLFAHKELSPEQKAQGNLLYDNFPYWAEKLVAIDALRAPAPSIYEFDTARFKAHVREVRLEWIRSARRHELLSKEERRELWTAIDTQLLEPCSEFSGLEDALAVLCDFEWSSPSCESFSVQGDDLDPSNLTSFSTTFQWACYAVALAHRLFHSSQTTAA